MRADLEGQLSQIPTMKTEPLRALWLELFGQPPHPKLRREILIPILGYRLQEKALGGLKPATAKRLRALAEDFAGGKCRVTSTTPRARTGARFVREYQGRLHEVAVHEGGFEYGGRTYRSLSHIAREITGTRWSGPAFFGLKKRKSKEAA